MPDSKIVGEIGNIIKEIKLGNSFLFIGIFTILIFIYCYTCDYCSSKSFDYLIFQFGIITLVFGGVFRLANIITRPFKYIKILGDEDENIYYSDRLKEANRLFQKSEKRKKPLELILFKWNDVFRFTIWISLLFVYLFWINNYIDILPPDGIKICIILFVFDIYIIFVSFYKLKRIIRLMGKLNI